MTGECSQCKCTKAKIKSFKRNMKFVYVNEFNKQWRGAVCPNCYKESITTKKIVKKTSRKCRNCKKSLPASRYFNCEVCVKELESDYNNDYEVHLAFNDNF